jgi:DNA-binding NtrC family response regulator
MKPLNSSLAVGIPNSETEREIQQAQTTVLTRANMKRKAFKWKKAGKIKVFLVDDDVVLLRALQSVVAGIDHRIEVSTFSSGEECIQNLKEAPVVVILDYYLDSQLSDAMNGIKVLKKIKQISPATNVIMLSAQSNIDVALDTIKYKAYDYVLKNDEAFIRIKNIIQHILEDRKTTENINNEIAIYRTVNIVIITVLILLFLLSRLM